MRAIVQAGRAAAAATLALIPLAAPVAAETPREAYTTPLSPDNAAVLFIDNQTNLLLGVQSINHTLLRDNTEGLAKLAAIFDVPVVLTTTGGGAAGPAGGLLPGITDTFPDVPVIDRTDYFNAMSDPRFAAAVEATGRRKVILAGLTTDYCLVYPAATLIDQGYHVYIVTDASGAWTDENQESAMQRLIQMGATPVNVQSLMGEMQNSAAVSDLAASKAQQPEVLAWFSEYSPAPSILNMNMAMPAAQPAGGEDEAALEGRQPVSDQEVVPDDQAASNQGPNGDDFTLVGRADTDAAGLIRITEGRDTIGDRIVFNNPIFDQANEQQVGLDQGQFVLVDPENMVYDGSFTLMLADGHLVVQGHTSNTETTTLAVTGGTGRFRSASGEVTLRPRDDPTLAFDVLVDLD